jgi:hypothetical protein
MSAVLNTPRWGAAPPAATAKGAAAMKTRVVIVLSLASPEFTEALRGQFALDRRIKPWEARKLAPYLAVIISAVDGELLTAMPCDAEQLRTLVHEERDHVGTWLAAHSAADLVTNTLRAACPNWGSA